MKLLQKKIGEEADKLLEDVTNMLSDDPKLSVTFVGGQELLDFIRKDKIGHLMLHDFNPYDLCLRMESPFYPIFAGDAITCQVVSSSKIIPEKDVTMSVQLNKKNIEVSRSTWNSVTFCSSEPGVYIVTATCQGAHVSHSPLYIPVTQLSAQKSVNSGHAKVIIHNPLNFSKLV